MQNMETRKNLELLLVTASAPEMRRIRRARLLNFQQITMPYLAALVPPGWQVHHVDEAVETLNYQAPADLAAITFHTPSAPHAYETAARLRQRGIPVVLGGPHASLLPEEAARHADYVVAGEAEALWPEFLSDFAAGRAQPIYRCVQPPELAGVPQARKDLYHRHDYTQGRLFATRGCPHHCDFCTPAVMYGSRLRRRPVAEVAAEFASFPGKVIIFWDENIAADRSYARELFRAITPYRKWWSSQASVHAGLDNEFLALASRSGCKQLFLGLESISQPSLDAAHKRFNRVGDYAAIIQRIHSHGIAVQAGLVFGFDGDPPGIFAETLDFLEFAGVQNATFNILTPFPGTPLFHRLEAEGRILTRDWRRYNGREDVVFTPRLMSPQQLLDGYHWANQRFYSSPSIARRLGRSPTGLWWTLPLNLAYTFLLHLG
jgi:radical SAM superfamily enzyme YgiQ (UPF0313 family)